MITFRLPRRWRIDEQTGEYLLLADRWHTCIFDLSGDQGLLGQVEGRPRLAGCDPGGRDRYVLCLCVRGRSGDPEYGIKNLLVRNLEHLSPAQFTKIMDTLQADPAGQEIAAAWIGKEKLRDVLNLRARVTGSTLCERDVRGRLFACYDWCAQNDDIPELAILAQTVSRPHRLHPRPPTQITHRYQQETTSGNRTKTPSRLTSTSQIKPGEIGQDNPQFGYFL